MIQHHKFSALPAVRLLDRHLDAVRSAGRWFRAPATVINLFQIFFKKKDRCILQQQRDR